MNKENEHQILFTEENAIEPISKEDKFDIFLLQGKRNSTKTVMSNLSFSFNATDMHRLINKFNHNHNNNNQPQQTKRKRNLISVKSLSSLSRSFMNCSFNTESSLYPIPPLTPTSKPSQRDIDILKNSKFKLPAMIDLNDQISIQAKAIEKEMTEAIAAYEVLSKSNQSLKESKSKLTTLQKELKEAKESRNQIMRDVYHMRNEIEMNQNQTLMTEGNLDLSFNYKTQRVLTSTAYGGRGGNCGYSQSSNYGSNVTYTTSNEPSALTTTTTVSSSSGTSDLDQQIELYEDKICKLKQENTAFFESFDLLKGDYALNEAQNIKLKNAMNSLEYNIQNSLKEKSNLKAVISKLSGGSNSNNNHTPHSNGKKK